MRALLLGVAVCSAAVTAPLANGLEMPLMGFGTAGGVGAEAVRWAYDAGVRLFDTAQATEWYNEPSVAEGLRGLDRSSYWLETKLHPRDLGFDSTLTAFKRSLRDLSTTYIDVFLLHFPRCSPPLCDSSPGTFLDSWRALEQLHKEGTVRAIGISNFDMRDLQTLLAQAKVVPHVLQNYFDPFHQDREVRELCKEKKIAYQGYSTLGTQWVIRGGDNPVLTHPVVRELAQSYERSPAQIVLAWAMSRGVAVIPRSVQKDNIKQNAESGGFEMDEGDLKRIDELDGEQGAPINDDSIEVVFVNSQDSEVDLLWSGPEELEPIVTLAPGESFTSQSYEGHNFVVQVEGDIKYDFDVTSSFPIYHLDESAVSRLTHDEL